eukprot:s7134_g1.t2
MLPSVESILATWCFAAITRGPHPHPSNEGPPPSRDHTQLGLGCLESAAHVLLRHCRAFAVTIGLSRKAKGLQQPPQRRKLLKLCNA